MKKSILLLIIFLQVNAVFGQIKAGGGISYGTDFYQRYVNPEVQGDTLLRSSGYIGSVNLGLKTWLGTKTFAVSLEGMVNFGPLGLDLNEYKGLGIISFPLIAKLNFGGITTFSDSKVLGGYIGGGLQYSKTELYAKPVGYRDKIERSLFPTYIFEIGAGVGSEGSASTIYVRYGFGEDKSSTLNIGIMYDFNFLN